MTTRPIHRLQFIEFWRNPDFLAFRLLDFARKGTFLAFFFDARGVDTLREPRRRSAAAEYSPKPYF